MRLDKYLKVTRIIKRRTVANEACDAAHVTVNGRPAKASYDVKVGDIVVSSGNGSVYPYGIPVGRVVETGMNAYSRTVEAKIEPFCDMTDMENVVILTSYDRFADGNKMPDTEVITDGEVSS